MVQEQLNRFKSKLTDPSFEKPYEALEEILELDQLDDVLFEFILGLDDKLVLAEFLKNCESFNESQLTQLESFIESSIDDEDRLFASELISVANEWNITSIYDKCLVFVADEKEDNLVILESIYMLYEHLEIDRIEEIFSVLEKVIHSSVYFQNCQVTAAFYLLRITGHKKYFEDIVGYVKSGQSMNKDVLKNLLSQEYNQVKYFSYHSYLQTLIVNLN